MTLRRAFRKHITRSIRAVAHHRSPANAQISKWIDHWRHAYENHNYDLATNGEFHVLENLNRPSVIFDVGANKGNYSAEALQKHPTATVHAFEPVALPNVRSKQLVWNAFALGNHRRKQEMYQAPKRNELCSSLGLNALQTLYPSVKFQAREVQFQTGAEYCRTNKVNQIDLLKIDCEGLSWEVLLGFGEFLEKTSVIQFEFGYLDRIAGKSLFHFYEHLAPMGFFLGRVYPQQVEYTTYSAKMEELPPGNYIANRTPE